MSLQIEYGTERTTQDYVTIEDGDCFLYPMGTRTSPRLHRKIARRVAYNISQNETTQIEDDATVTPVNCKISVL